MHTGIFIVDNLLRDPLTTVFIIIAIILAVTVHEFAHAFTAARQGDQTARSVGRVSLNPLAHLDPAGSFLFLIAGFGWGKPVPVNPYMLKDGRLGDFYVSIAGIVTNLITAFIFALPFQILHYVGGDISSSTLVGGTNTWLNFCQVVVEVNILLAAFNLLPIPPLDGSKAIGILVPRSARHSYAEFLRVGPVLLLALVVLSFMFNINVFGAILNPITAAFRFLVFIPTSL